MAAQNLRSISSNRRRVHFPGRRAAASSAPVSESSGAESGGTPRDVTPTIENWQTIAHLLEQTRERAYAGRQAAAINEIFRAVWELLQLRDVAPFRSPSRLVRPG